MSSLLGGGGGITADGGGGIGSAGSATGTGGPVEIGGKTEDKFADLSTSSSSSELDSEA